MKLGIIGATGRMGQAIIRHARYFDVRVTAALVSQQSARYGEPIYPNLANGGVRFQYAHEVQPEQVDVLIDFSLPQALADNVALAKRLGVAIVVCTTGLTATQQQYLQDAAQHIPVLYAANTSVGITLLRHLVQLAAAVLPDTDIEVIEAHHSAKRDGPSGTAIALGESAAAGRGHTLSEISAGVRAEGVRKSGSIGFSVIRAADIIGEHTVMLAHAGERLELTHRVSNRRVFAQGALQAALWLQGQPAGLYGMADMLQLETQLQQLAQGMKPL
ncbi:dihydrodipicolinate reductase [Pseudidiomarina indica]|uniref:4-hydroxy-tetrahydrodipicolinate reductase n=1 Tax=Pseudidiomarina indica TaxID=1159017 RepID=A0A1G6DM96_9GAMM|nr:4-hydroxy-tetrahydrodipicolinate reductase [Pseudidiomarina indica]SDB46252.1 dihydrodipicolinate reductase [Pseudidiomarina indica]